MGKMLDGVDGPETEITIGEYFSYLAGSHWEKDVLHWPQDVFCLMAALLQKTGGYIRYIKRWPPVPGPSQAVRLKTWTGTIRNVGFRWWLAASHKHSSGEAALTTLPPEIQQWWKAVVARKNDSLANTEKSLRSNSPGNDDFWNAVLQLCSAADEACIGMGLSEASPHQRNPELTKTIVPTTDLLWIASKRLIAQNLLGKPSTLTRYVKPWLAVVLPKLHTPQSGITLRSISHNLAFIRATEVVASFDLTVIEQQEEVGQNGPQKHALNLLLFPWPTEIVPADFRQVGSKMQELAPEFGFFEYAPKRNHFSKIQLAKMRKALRRAIDDIGQIDGVIFPELALSHETQGKVTAAIRKECPDCFLIAGVGNTPTDGSYSENKAVFSAPTGAAEYTRVQHKHHRWQLDPSQINQYGLGSQLDPSPSKRGWWEHIEIHRRNLSFLSVTDEITVAMLICEDLARQDPIAELVRSVGPNLVVALLMDGPQLGSRWPARYATIFADDPGSSVLTLTSVGMSALSRPAGKPVSRVVGLWKDHFQGLKEIELAPDADAVALSLTMETHTEWTADGRNDEKGSTYLSLNGIHQIRG